MDVPLTLTDAAAQLRRGQFSSVELIRAVLHRADLVDAALGTYVTRFDEHAIASAARADQELAEGLDRGPLHGMPIAIKDIISVAEGPTRANSVVCDPRWGVDKDAPVVRRLKDAGAVITGKATTAEFAVGAPEESKPFPIPRNPWDPACTPGGSSSGSAIGVAAGLFLASIGTDTGGSIRIPVAWNGTTGLKPTFGRVPVSGCIPLGFTLDHVGPLARSARDCAAVLQVLAGHHASDPSSSLRPVGGYGRALDGMLDGIRVGVDRSARFFPASSDPSLSDCFAAALESLRERGAELVDVVIPLYEEVSTARVVMMSAEALAYHRQNLRQRWSDYTAQARLQIARGALSSAADYVQAARVRRQGQRRLAGLFEHVDVVATPTIATGAPRLADVSELGFAAAGTIFTSYWDAVGNPCLAIPMGFASTGMPLSLQLAAPPFDEGRLLRVADAYQRGTDWHLRVPPTPPARGAPAPGR